MLGLPLVSAFSTNPADYIFADFGDRMQNGTFTNTPADDDLLTNARWTIGAGSSLTYDDDTVNKTGNMTIRHPNTGTTKYNKFNFGRNLTNATIQLSYYNAPSDTGLDSAPVYLYSGADIAIFTIVEQSVAPNNYRYDTPTIAVTNTPITRADYYMNHTFYINPNGNSITYYLNGTKIYNETTSAEGIYAILFGVDQSNPSNSHWDNILVWNGTPDDVPLQSEIIPTPPQITFYNMTSEGGEGCTNWNTAKSNACTTSDATPTIFIRTNELSTCAIGASNLNYTMLGSNRTCSGGGSEEHTCTLTSQDELKEEISFIYIGCQDLFGHENLTSTSGALKMSIFTSDLESRGRYGIETGAQAALTSGYTIYTNQKVYARNSANQQSIGTFDKDVKRMNKIWAFNFLTGNDTVVGMFNITPVLYTLEIRNMTNSTVNTTIYNFIQATR